MHSNRLILKLTVPKHIRTESMIYVRQSSAFRVLALLASASGVTCLSDGGWERVLSMDFYVRSSIVLPGKDYQNTFFSNSPFFFIAEAFC